VAAVAALATILAITAPPASAGEAATRPQPAPARLNLAAATAGPLVAAPEPRAFAQASPAAPAPDTQSDSRPFLKTRTGRAAIVLMLVGAAYTLYSVGHDSEPVHSPVR
jgi:hypothetical protein